MAGEIFKLFGSVMLKDEATKGLDKVDKKVNGVSKKLGGMSKTALKWGAGIAAGAGVAITGAVALGKKVGNVADRLLDLNSITGMSTDEIQKWQHASVIAGTSAEAMTKASQKLTMTMDTMINSGGKSAEAVEKLGLSVDQVSNMNADERMNALVNALQGVEDKTERAKLGTDLFGKTWGDIAPIVDLGVEGLKEAKDNANVFDNESLNNANNFRIMFDDMKDKIGFVALNLGMKLIPLVSQFAEFIMQNMPVIQQVFKTTFGVIGEITSVAVKIIQSFIATMREWVGANSETLGQATEVFSGFSTAIKGILSGDLGAFLEGYHEFIKNIFGEKIANTLDIYITSFIELIQGFIVVAVEFWNKYGENLISIVTTAFNLVKETIDTVLKIIIDIFDVFKAIFSGDWGKTWEAIGKLFKDVWNGILKFVSDALNAIVNIFENLYPILLDIGKNLFSFLWQGLKMLWSNIIDWINNSVIQPFLQFWKDIFDDMLQIGKDILNGLLNGLKWLWEHSLYKWLFDKTVEFVKKFKDIDLLQVGKDILQGLINGLTNMWDKVKEVVGNIASTVKDKFKEILGINSPSKVFEEFGKNIDEGLKQGIEGNQGIVETAVTSLGDMVSTTMGNIITAAKQKAERIASIIANANSQGINLKYSSESGYSYGKNSSGKTDTGNKKYDRNGDGRTSVHEDMVGRAEERRNWVKDNPDKAKEIIDKVEKDHGYTPTIGEIKDRYDSGDYHTGGFVTDDMKSNEVKKKLEIGEFVLSRGHIDFIDKNKTKNSNSRPQIVLQINNPKFFNQRDVDEMMRPVIQRLRALGVTM